MNFAIFQLQNSQLTGIVLYTVEVIQSLDIRVDRRSRKSIKENYHVTSIYISMIM